MEHYINKIIQGDCLEEMKRLPDNSIDTIITDPPYELSFMSKKWDNTGVSFSADVWKECLRVAKPGATLLSFGGSRTWHRLACAIEDAGWTIKDTIMWVTGQGFPKATNISLQLDKKAGLQGQRGIGGFNTGGKEEQQNRKAKLYIGSTTDGSKLPAYKDPKTPQAKLWNGWKSHGLKPSYEIILSAQKPLDISEQKSKLISEIIKLQSRLCLLLSAETAAKLIKNISTEQELANIAQWSVEKSTNIKEDLLGQMDMCQLEEMVKTILNTVILWRMSLEELWDTTNKSIIKTEIDKIIDWQTLSLCLLESTPQDIIGAETKQPGVWLNASPVARILNAVSVSINATQELFVVGNAISSQLIKQQGVAEKTLSPNLEPIVMAVKPNEGSYAENALKWGVAGLNIDGGRIGYKGENDRSGWHKTGADGSKGYQGENTFKIRPISAEEIQQRTTLGRFPANLILECICDEVKEEPIKIKEGERAGGIWKTGGKKTKMTTYQGGNQTHTNPECPCYMLDEASNNASRFFYVAKASRSERNRGCEKMFNKKIEGTTNNEYMGLTSAEKRKLIIKNNHPTVKPLKLMEYLCLLTKTPTGGIILDPFAGSGTTCMAAKKIGRNFIGIEKEQEYIDIANARINNT